MGWSKCPPVVCVLLIVALGMIVWWLDGVGEVGVPEWRLPCVPGVIRLSRFPRTLPWSSKPWNSKCSALMLTLKEKETEIVKKTEQRNTNDKKPHRGEGRASSGG